MNIKQIRSMPEKILIINPKLINKLQKDLVFIPCEMYGEIIREKASTFGYKGRPKKKYVFKQNLYPNEIGRYYDKILVLGEKQKVKK